MSEATLEIADQIREWRDEPKRVNSGCRCVDKNRAVGGAPASRHLPRLTDGLWQADGMDIGDSNPNEIGEWLEVNFPWVSFICYSSWIHIDTRPGKAVRQYR